MVFVSEISVKKERFLLPVSQFLRLNAAMLPNVYLLSTDRGQLQWERDVIPFIAQNSIKTSIF